VVDCESQLRSAYTFGPITCRGVSPWFFRLADATACSALHQEEPAARRRRRRSVASSDGHRGRVIHSCVPANNDIKFMAHDNEAMSFLSHIRIHMDCRVQSQISILHLSLLTNYANTTQGYMTISRMYPTDEGVA
jgi:hypothetical protein